MKKFFVTVSIIVLIVFYTILGIISIVNLMRHFTSSNPINQIAYARNGTGRTNLHIAASGVEPDMIRVLLDFFEADIDAQDNRGRTPLMNVVVERISPKYGIAHNPELLYRSISYLLEASPQLELQDQLGLTALMHALENGENDSIQILLDAGASVEARKQDGKTPLMWAAEHGRTVGCEMLLKAGANVNARDHEGRNALMWSIRQVRELDHPIALDILLAAGADIETTCNQGWTPLAYAAEYGPVSNVRLLLEAGADPAPLGWTPVHILAILQDEEKLSTNLSKYGALEVRDMWGRIPLMWAAHNTYSNDNTLSNDLNGKNEFLDWFIQAGSDIETKDIEGRTALMLASEFAGKNEIATLINAGANVNAIDVADQTSLMYTAKQRTGYEKTKLLIVSGANIDLQDQKGMTALMHAVDMSNIENCKILIEAGVRLDLKDDLGRDALDYAYSNNTVENKWRYVSRSISRILKTAGAR